MEPITGIGGWWKIYKPNSQGRCSMKSNYPLMKPFIELCPLPTKFAPAGGRPYRHDRSISCWQLEYFNVCMCGFVCRTMEAFCNIIPPPEIRLEHKSPKWIRLSVRVNILHTVNVWALPIDGDDIPLPCVECAINHRCKNTFTLRFPSPSTHEDRGPQ